MKIRRGELERIIREELAAVMEVNPYHKGKGSRSGGRFTSKEKAATYSLSNRAKKLLAKDSELEAPLRGKVTKSGRVTALAGMNSSDEKSCGRIRLPSGDDKEPVSHSCEDYPARYSEAFDIIEEVAEELFKTINESDQCDACLQNFIQRLKRSNLALKTALDPKVAEHSVYGGQKVSKGDRKTAKGRSGAFRRKMKRMAGMEFPKSGFHSDETKLLRPDSLYE